MIADERNDEEWHVREKTYSKRPVASALSAGLLLTGCSSLPASVNPSEWWHDLQGGAIAEQRPPPPGAADPFPNLATVPAKPSTTDASSRHQIADALVADRTNAQHAAALAPLADPSSPASSPALFGQGSAPPPGPARPGQPPPLPPETAATASLDAATPPPPPSPRPAPPAPPAVAAPPAPPAASAPPPIAAVPAPAAPAPKSAAASPVSPLSGDTPLAPAPSARTAETRPLTDPALLPPLPAAPPAPPALAGGSVAAAQPPRPAAAPPSKPAAQPVPPAVAAAPVAVAFAPGSAQLPTPGTTSLRSLAGQRGEASIQVTGFGEARSFDPDDQATGLSLALSRAQTMADALTAAGVPAAAVQIDAEAVGRGGTARLVN